MIDFISFLHPLFMMNTDTHTDTQTLKQKTDSKTKLYFYIPDVHGPSKHTQFLEDSRPNKRID